MRKNTTTKLTIDLPSIANLPASNPPTDSAREGEWEVLETPPRDLAAFVLVDSEQLESFIRLGTVALSDGIASLHKTDDPTSTASQLASDGIDPFGGSIMASDGPGGGCAVMLQLCTATAVVKHTMRSEKGTSNTLRRPLLQERIVR